MDGLILSGALIAMGLTGVNMILADRALRRTRRVLTEIEARVAENARLVRDHVVAMSLLDAGGQEDALASLERESAHG